MPLSRTKPEPNSSGADSKNTIDCVAAPLSTKDAQVTLGELQQELNRLQRSIRLAIQGQLGKLCGQSMASLAENRDLAKSIHQMLESHGLRVRCSECGHPAILRVSPGGSQKTGVFVFDHTLDGRRTFHGGKTVVPALMLVAKPARRTKDRAAS